MAEGESPVLEVDGRAPRTRWKPRSFGQRLAERDPYAVDCPGHHDAWILIALHDPLDLRALIVAVTSSFLDKLLYGIRPQRVRLVREARKGVFCRAPRGAGTVALRRLGTGRLRRPLPRGPLRRLRFRDDSRLDGLCRARRSQPQPSENDGEQCDGAEGEGWTIHVVPLHRSVSSRGRSRSCAAGVKCVLMSPRAAARRVGMFVLMA